MASQGTKLTFSVSGQRKLVPSGGKKLGPCPSKVSKNSKDPNVKKKRLKLKKY
jgi:hypothetical protein